MFRAVARRLRPGADIRQLVLRINAVEASMLDLQRFKDAVERVHPEVAEQATRMALERRTREQAANAQPPVEGGMRPFEEIPLTTKEFEDLHQFYALQPIEQFPMASLTTYDTEGVLMELTNRIQRQYVVRVAHVAAQLNNAPLGLSLMPSIQELRKWYELSFHDVSTLPSVTDRAGLVAFTKLLKRIFVRHINTASLLARGLSELAVRDEWSAAQVVTPAFLRTFALLEDTIRSFSDARIRLRFLVAHMLRALSKDLGPEELGEHGGKWIDDWDYFDHDPALFRGAVCRETSLLRLTQHAVREVQTELPPAVAGCISVNVVGDEAVTFVGVPQLLTEAIASLVSEAVSPRNRAAPPEKNDVRITVVQNPKSAEVALLVSDQAGGMPLRELEPRQTFLASTAAQSVPPSSRRWNHPMALPYTGAVAKMLGGCVTTATVEAYGTDRVLYIPRGGFDQLKI